MRYPVSRALWIAISLSVLIAGCSRYEEPVTSAPSNAAATAKGTISADGSHEEAGDGPFGTREGSPRKGGITVTLSPSSPTRISPPILMVHGSSFEKEREFRNILWFVNGRELPGGERMEPEMFRKGDRIRARGTILLGQEDIPFETLEVVAENSPPEIGTVHLEPKALTTGGTVKAVATVSDPDGDAVKKRFVWFVDDKPVPGESEVMVLTGVKKGAWVHVRVSTHDGSAEGSWKYSPKYLVVNSLPVVKSRLPEEIPPDRLFSYRIEAEDPDGDPLTYDLVKSPPGMVLSGSTLEWEVTDGILGKTVEVVVGISDGDGGRTVHTFSMNIQPRNGG